MPATDARSLARVAVELRADPVEARLVERAIAVVRALLAIVAILVVRLGPPQQYGPVIEVLLFVYVGFATILLLALRRSTTLPRHLPVIIQTTDVAFATVLTLFSEGLNSPMFTFLLYPLLAAAYRWGFREVMITAAGVAALMAAEVMFVRTPMLWADFILRAIYVGATGAAVGYLAENEKRRRLEARDLLLVLMRARLGGKLGETITLVLGSVRRVFRAKQVLLVLQERHSGRVWLWSTDAAEGGETAVRLEPLSGARRDLYLFEAPGDAWHATAGRVPGRRRRYRAVAVDGFGRWLSSNELALPDGFVDTHRCRRLIGVSLKLSDEWSGRVFVLWPGYGVHREQSARFALQLANQVGPAVYGLYLLRSLRTRAQSMERGRIARELHDGITQSLLGLEMEIAVLRRRAIAGAPQLVDDLARVHSIVRNEVIMVRELMEGIRVGDVEPGDLMQHLSEIVDRFDRHTGIAAQFVSDGREVRLPPHVCRGVARILHEALINVRKHSGARRVVVRANNEAMRWKLSIEDDGRGFPFAGRLSDEELEESHQGPRTIAERVRLLDGVMTVESRPGSGARIEIAVPRQAAR